MDIERPVEVIKPEKSTKEKVFKIAIAIIFSFFIIILIYYKIQTPSFKWGWFILIGVILVVVSSILIFGFNINRWIKLKNDEKNKVELPEPASEELLKLRVKTVIESELYKNHIKKYLNVTPHNINNNLILDFELELLYNEQKDDICHVVINSHFINRLPAVIFNPKSYTLNKVINDASSKPFMAPNIERSEVFNPITQTYQKLEKKTQNIEVKKDDKKQEDLA